MGSTVCGFGCSDRDHQSKGIISHTPEMLQIPTPSRFYLLNEIYFGKHQILFELRQDRYETINGHNTRESPKIRFGPQDFGARVFH